MAPTREIADQSPSDPLEGVWKALANIDRRRILDLLRDAADRAAGGWSDPETGGGLPTGDLVMALSHISRYAVMQHLKVLHKAGLVTSRKHGRLVLNYLNAVPLRMIYERWVNRFEGHWASSLIALKTQIEGGGMEPRLPSGGEADGNRSPAEGGRGSRSATPSRTRWRHILPHIDADDRAMFVTFCTKNRWELPPEARSVVLSHCLHDHGSKMFVHAVVVMPDHVHLVYTPLKDAERRTFGLAELMQSIKGSSAHRINAMLKRSGAVWQEGYFDRLLRHDEDLYEKMEYVCLNPVRRGLSRTADEYQWIWREWIEGKAHK